LHASSNSALLGTGMTVEFESLVEMSRTSY
jgi:hypothetical protein